MGAADGVAAASRRFADELARDRRPAALPVTALTATLRANAVFLRTMARVMRDISDDIAPRSRVDDRYFDEVAHALGGYVGEAPDG